MDMKTRLSPPHLYNLLRKFACIFCFSFIKKSPPIGENEPPQVVRTAQKSPERFEQHHYEQTIQKRALVGKIEI